MRLGGAARPLAALLILAILAGLGALVLTLLHQMSSPARAAPVLQPTAGASKMESEAWMDPQIARKVAEVRGTLRIVGTSEQPRMLIVAASGTCYWLPRDYRPSTSLWNLAGREVRAVGWIELHEVRRADGKSLGFETLIVPQSIEVVESPKD